MLALCTRLVAQNCKDKIFIHYSKTEGPLQFHCGMTAFCLQYFAEYSVFTTMKINWGRVTIRVLFILAEAFCSCEKNLIANR